MAYTPTNWVANTTVVSAAALNNIESGIVANEQAAAAAQTAADNAVKYNAAQSLNDAQKAQARGNIGAASAAEVGTVPSGANLQGEVDDLKSTVNSLNNLEYPVDRTYVSGLTYGRIFTTGIATGDNYKYIAYMTDMRETGETWYFDASQYRLQYAFYDNATDANASSISSWITASPATVPTTKPFYRLMVSMLTDTGTLDISGAENSVYYNSAQESDLVDFANNTNAHFDQLDSDISNLQNTVTSGRSSVELDLSTSPNTRFYSRKILKTEEIYPLTFNCTNASYSYYILYYNDEDTLLSNTSWQKGSYTISTASFPENATYCKMGCKADAETALSDAEKAYFSAYYVPQIYKDVETLKQKEQIYYVSTSGNDGNAGTKAAPFKTISKALNSNAKKIFVTPGTYSERLNLYGVSGLVIAPLYGGFSTSDYSAKIVLDGINTRPYLIDLQDSADVTLIGIKAVNYTNSGFKMVNCTGVKCFSCEAAEQYGTYQYGMGFELIKTDAEFNDCLAHDVKLDGFNIHDYGDTVFNNCVAYNCGDDGISHHDACVGHIFGGEYYNCGKGGVSSPTHGAYVDVEGVYAHDNVYGLYTGNTSGRRNCKARILNCVFKDNSTVDIQISGTDAIGWNNIYSTKTVATGSTFTEIIT